MTETPKVTMAGRRIGIDFDTTLARVFEVQIALLNREFGTDYSVADFTDWDTRKTLTREEDEYIWRVFHDPEVTRIAPAQPLSIPFVQRAMGEGAAVFILSDRPQEHYSRIANWITARIVFSSVIPPIILTGSPLSRSTGNQPSKHEVARVLRLDTIVEDAPHHALDMLELGIRTYLLDSPPNRYLGEVKGITRVPSWKKIVELEQMEGLIG